MALRRDSDRPAFFDLAVVLVPVSVMIFSSGLSAAGGRGDVSGDGFGDLVVGAPGETVGGWVHSGIMLEMLGTGAGLSSTGAQWWTPDYIAVTGDAGHDEYFAAALAMGDFDGDGVFDVAIGIPGEDYNPGAIESAGAVHILYGNSPGGLGIGNQRVFDQGTSGMPGAPEENDSFGEVLAAGDLDGDGFWDLVVGSPSEDVGTITDAGAITVLYGSSAGLVTDGSQFLDQSTSGIPGDPEANDRFGRALTVGDFNGDGYGDVAVGVSFEDIGTVLRAGAVNILYGSSSGLATTGSQLWYQGLYGMLENPEEDDHFGSSLAAGYFNHDGYQDLAVGVPGEDYEPLGLDSAGAVAILYGSAGGLSDVGNEHWWETDTGVGVSHDGDSFGSALAAADFDGDDYSDLAIGAPGEDFAATISRVGAVTVVYGSAGGLQSSGNQIWGQGLGGLFDEPEAGDAFGERLAAGDFNGDGWADLAIGAPSEDLGGKQEAGIVHALYGSSAGITATGNQIWTQVHFGEVIEANDLFGLSIAAVSRPAQIFFDGFESGNTSAW